jgi:T5SS/PEP-CTERM-associated repeat protein
LNGTNVFTDPNGGFLHVGRDGTGYMFVSDGATVTMNADGHPFPGFQVGRNAGSFGHMVVDGAGTTVTIDGSTVASSNPNEIGFIAVGRAGTGRLDITNGATVTNDPNGGTLIGVSRDGVGGRGSVSVDGANSVLDGGSVIELGDPNGNGGLGRLAVSNGGKVLADVINVHAGGILTGDLGSVGDALNNVMVNVMGGVVAPGFSPGTMTIHGDLVLSGGELILEAFSDTLFDQIIVEGDLILDGGSIQVVLGYTPTAPLDFFQVMGTTSIGAGFAGIDVFAPLGSGVEEGSIVTVDIDGTIFNEQAVLQQAPAPATLALLAPALALGGLALRRPRYDSSGTSNGAVLAS